MHEFPSNVCSVPARSNDNSVQFYSAFLTLFLIQLSEIGRKLNSSTGRYLHFNGKETSARIFVSYIYINFQLYEADPTRC